MLDKRNYELEYMRELQGKYKKDPALLERVLYAFGLLEALKVSGLPFVFKGGSCLMLLLEHPMRLSTDIDIIVAPGTDVDEYIHKAGTIFPFVTCEEQIRVGRNSIEKRHFKFIYQSPLQEKEFYILLDILFSEIPYVETIEKEVKNELLIVDGLKTMVTVPSAECILGDKLTAFAPHTTGVPLGVGKSMEIAKQLFDVAALIDAMEDQDIVRKTYDKVVLEELGYRGLTIGKEEVLQDTINACLSIISRGTMYKEDYAEYNETGEILVKEVRSGKYGYDVDDVIKYVNTRWTGTGGAIRPRTSKYAAVLGVRTYKITKYGVENSKYAVVRIPWREELNKEQVMEDIGVEEMPEMEYSEDKIYLKITNRSNKIYQVCIADQNEIDEKGDPQGNKHSWKTVKPGKSIRMKKTVLNTYAVGYRIPGEKEKKNSDLRWMSNIIYLPHN